MHGENLKLIQMFLYNHRHFASESNLLHHLVLTFTLKWC